MIKYSNQLEIYKLGWGLELGTTKKQTRIVLRAELETGPSECKYEALISHPYGFPPKRQRVIDLLLIICNHFVCVSFQARPARGRRTPLYTQIISSCYRAHNTVGQG